MGKSLNACSCGDMLLRASIFILVSTPTMDSQPAPGMSPTLLGCWLLCSRTLALSICSGVGILRPQGTLGFYTIIDPRGGFGSQGRWNSQARIWFAPGAGAMSYNVVLSWPSSFALSTDRVQIVGILGGRAGQSLPSERELSEENTGQEN